MPRGGFALATAPEPGRDSGPISRHQNGAAGSRHVLSRSPNVNSGGCGGLSASLSARAACHFNPFGNTSGWPPASWPILSASSRTASGILPAPKTWIWTRPERRAQGSRACRLSARNRRDSPAAFPLRTDHAPSVVLKTAVETPPEWSSPSAASVCSEGSCHPLGELRGS